MLSLADRAYDRMVTSSPYDNCPEPPLPGDPGWPRCSNCGAWLKMKPDTTKSEDHVLLEYCNGEIPFPGIEPICGMTLRRHFPHAFVAHAWGILHRFCKRCGQDNQEVDV